MPTANQTSPVSDYLTAEAAYLKAERGYSNGAIPLSEVKTADVLAQSAYERCVESGLDPFTNRCYEHIHD